MPKKSSFESRMQHIESLCDKLDTDIDLNEMMKLYEEAINEIAECKKMLDSYSKRIEELTPNGTKKPLNIGENRSEKEE